MINYGYVNHQVEFIETRHLASKLVLTWLYLVKTRVILGRKDVSKNVESQFVNGGIY